MVFAERFREQGWLRVDGLFDLQLIDAVRCDYERQVEALMAPRNGHRGYTHAGGDERRHILSVKLAGALLDPALWANPIVMAILRALLGTDLLIDNLTCVNALPGARDQLLHRDHPPLFPEQPAIQKAVNPYAVTLVIPLIDLSEATGSTKLFSGSHHDEAGEEYELPLVRRGGCYLMDYRLSHFGTANRSDTARPMLFIVYARPWFTDIRNLRRQERLNIANDDVVALPREHWPLFRRMAAKGALDLSQRELFPEE